MKIIADLHIHSRFSRATSPSINVKNISEFAKLRGLNLIGSGDFTHPSWLKELKEFLEPGEGIFSYNDCNFVLSTEVSNIYSQGGKLRKIHTVLLAPSFEIVEQINELLAKKGKLEADGRPIFGSYSCYELVEDLKNISDDIEIIPAHVWTPWFGLLGSKSGFDSVEECFKEQSKHIYALETGLSSDPEMNWRLSKLDKYTLVSNSDAHSLWPWRLGREANIFDFKELTYKAVIKAIREKEGFIKTIEVNPSYGKYHFDGHRLCNVCLSPEETKKVNGICPKCGKKITIGVLNRVEELADRPSGFKPKNALPFKHIIPLSELIAAIENTNIATQRVWNIYHKLIKEFKNEFNILLNVEKEKLRKFCDEKLLQVILENRQGKIKIKPGFDGEYGKLILEGEKQEKLF
ncbi:DNA helicase UvrD [Candidatus Pacearchaeota archaeon ex4484_26]|nr:MAG: DNA helicase UvrD [Candidatus Pacearchaeota archaeon ex4484_26]